MQYKIIEYRTKNIQHLADWIEKMNTQNKDEIKAITTIIEYI